MINMNYRLRELVGANVCTLLIQLSCYGYPYIRIRNVCFFYRKSGIVSFFQDIEWNKVELYGFFGNYP